MDRSGRILLLIPTTSYKAEDFLAAAGRLGAAVVVGTDRRQALEEERPGDTLVVDLDDPVRTIETISRHHHAAAFDAILGTDDETTVLATRAAKALGLPHNPVEAVEATRDKFLMRRHFSAAGLAVPRFDLLPSDSDPEPIASRVAYPCVLKPVHLSASRGVIRADDAAQFVDAFRRISRILELPEVRKTKGASDRILVEDYIPGTELSLEGLLVDGVLRPLALFDKPDPLEGPTFAETIYVTPSRQPADVQQAIFVEVERACRAIGLRHGPVHAELRLPGGRPWLLEVAARSIGGLCSRALRFGVGISLEELILRHALGQSTHGLDPEPGASGVMMVPVSRAGTLRSIHGREAALSVARIVEIDISVPLGAELEPLPEGQRYLGFLFARAPEPEIVEEALRKAGACLEFEID